MSDCPLRNVSFVGKVAGDAFLDAEYKCRVCGRLAGLHPPPVDLASSASAGQFSSVDKAAQLNEKLRHAHKDRPVTSIVSRILHSEHYLNWAIQSTENAANVYEEFEAMTTTLTKSFIAEVLGVRINGPFDDKYPFVLAGSDRAGRPKAVKILRHDEEIRLNYGQHQAQLEMEAKVSELLGDVAGHALVPTAATAVTLPKTVARHGTTDQEGRVTVIVMPRYVGTVRSSPSGCTDALAAQGARIVAAVRHLHDKGLVHMDIKSTNVFLDERGDWFLGDFGSCKFIFDPADPDRPDQHVTSCTSLFCYCNQTLPKYDWFMLLSILMIEGLDDRDQFRERLIRPGTGHMDLDLSRALAQEYMQRNDAFGKLVACVLAEFEASVN